jgi:hypothetical protein
MPELYKKWNLIILDKLCRGCIIIEEEWSEDANRM